MTVLLYHRFGDDRYPTTNIGTGPFFAQMAYLQKNGYRVLALSELVQALAAGQKPPDKAVVITIDDGYQSVYQKAWPILRDFGYPATVFLYVQGVDRGYQDYMDWAQVRELKEAGVDFQSHGYGHLHLTERPAGLDDQAYQARIRADLSRGSRIMQAELGRAPEFLAVPYGEYNRQVMAVAAELGFKALFTQDPGAVSRHTELLAVPREALLGYEWSTMEHFEQILARRDLPFTAMLPDIVPLTEPAPARFGARLLDPDRYLAAGLRIYVSELGWQPATLTGDFASIANTAVLHHRVNRVAISGREKESGRTAIRFWLLINDKAAEITDTK